MSSSASTHRVALSIDLDEWYHSRRWLDGQQAVAIPDTKALFRQLYGRDEPAGEIVDPTYRLLELFERHRVRGTFFVLGEMVHWYPDLVREIAQHGHEIACHGMHHVDMTVLGPDLFARQLSEARHAIFDVTGMLPVGYRAPNLVYEPWATAILESQGFLYDSSVCVSRSIGGKYKGWLGAPIHPYHPAYSDIARPGGARLIELPLPPFPVLRLSAGSGIMTRMFGYHWSAIALSRALHTGDTGYYFHPWEVDGGAHVRGSGLKGVIFRRRTGPWMLRTLERLLRQFEGRLITAGEAASRCDARPDSPAVQPLADPVA